MSTRTNPTPMFEIGVIIQKNGYDPRTGKYDYSVWFALPDDGDDFTNGFIAGDGFPTFKAASEAALALAGPNLTIRHVLRHKEDEATCTTCSLPFDPEEMFEGECEKCYTSRQQREREHFGLERLK